MSANSDSAPQNPADSDNPFVRCSQIAPRVLSVNGVNVLFPIRCLTTKTSGEIVVKGVDDVDKTVFEGRRKAANLVFGRIVQALDALGRKNEIMLQEALAEIDKLAQSEKEHVNAVKRQLAELAAAVNEALAKNSVPDAITASEALSAYAKSVVDQMN